VRAFCRAGEDSVVITPPETVPVAFSVPATAKVLPDPMFMPTDVPVPSALKIASTVSKSVLILVPHVSVYAPTSGLTRLRFVVFVSAIWCASQWVKLSSQNHSCGGAEWKTKPGD
jgi:hypothetical protein